jgi:hypothetical protein
VLLLLLLDAAAAAALCFHPLLQSSPLHHLEK